MTALLAGCLGGSGPPTTTALTNPPDAAGGGPSFDGAPPEVNNRVPLFYCGADIQFPPFEDLEHDPGSGDCFEERVEAGLVAEWIRVSITFEGDPILRIVRFLDDGTLEQYTDSTRDNFGTRAWFFQTCGGYDSIEGEVVGCGEAVQLSPEVTG
jgi:hypothetical protein